MADRPRDLADQMVGQHNLNDGSLHETFTLSVEAARLMGKSRRPLPSRNNIQSTATETGAASNAYDALAINDRDACYIPPRRLARSPRYLTTRAGGYRDGRCGDLFLLIYRHA
jgi:hypothetical protein